MFRNRTNSQKPDEAFYNSFKQNFPTFNSVAQSAHCSAEAPSAQRAPSLGDALTDASIPHRHFEAEDLKDHEVTPKGFQDHWRFTPSLMDPNSFAFASFANQPPGYYTPTPGGMNTLYHSQAGDLHTPGMGMNVGTPLSLPQTAHGMHADSAVDMHQFHPQLLQQHQFHDPFAQPQTQTSFAPSSFVHQDSGYEAMNSNENSPIENMGMMQRHDSGVTQLNMKPSEATMGGMAVPVGEKFRYHVTLNAPTAMIRHSDEIPVTYLNKGQAYSMSVVDTAPMIPTQGPVKYRTLVRVSFEDEQQRAKPSSCWQLWKEGRGTNEAHQRGGKLLAVEHVDPNQGGDDETRRPQIEVEMASFDGFCVTWTANPATGASDCSISVRFNFLSTDFSHSKGVKGIPVRLCAKTEMIVPSQSDSPLVGDPEVCYCKVKLFRDHGAERKLSNDVAHVKKTIDKLKQQIAQAESGLGNFGKRKRSGSIAKGSGGNRPGKVVKHKRTWSMDSDGDNTGKLTAEEDLHMKLATMQDMFSSTRPVSVLYLKGEDQDDPDRFPVQMSGENQDDKLQVITRQSTWESRPSADTTPVTSNLVSPTPSSISMASPNRNTGNFQFQQPLPFQSSRHGSQDWAQTQSGSNPSSRERVPTISSTQSPQPAKKVQKVQAEGQGALGGWIEAVGVDSAYQPPPERPIKPVACFYVLVKSPSLDGKSDLYRAVYLLQRKVKDLINGIAEKCEIDPISVTRAIRVNPKGLKIAVDEDVVRELPEGQDMIVEFSDIQYEQPVKNEFFNESANIQVDGIGVVEDATASGIEMRLIY